ncbi:MAG: hypothetical protein GX827_04520 [Clostridiales bacterium]|jgi:hypothetical protein|nr:hypothetical protein [Clostridiales bacterium]
MKKITETFVSLSKKHLVWHQDGLYCFKKIFFIEVPDIAVHDFYTAYKYLVLERNS